MARCRRSRVWNCRHNQSTQNLQSILETLEQDSCAYFHHLGTQTPSASPTTCYRRSRSILPRLPHLFPQARSCTHMGSGQCYPKNLVASASDEEKPQRQDVLLAKDRISQLRSSSQIFCGNPVSVFQLKAQHDHHSDYQKKCQHRQLGLYHQ